jgi:hypothetical protein
MRLHDLQVGQRFTFIGKHRGKVFEIKATTSNWVAFEDIATGQLRHTYANRKTFRMEVELEQPADRFTPDERKLLDEIFSTAYLLECDEENREDRKSAITALHGKITGLPGRRTVLLRKVK